MAEINERTRKRGQLMYIIEAAVEYLISILVSGSYLATLTREIGISDSLTGILSSFISLGCLFQLLSMLFYRRRVKGMVVVMSVANQLLFLLLYIIPLLGVGKLLKVALFVAAIFIAYVIYNFAHPKKINWLMSLVDDDHRGRFTANKEIVSLIAGIVFSFCMGALVDYYAARGQIRTAFILSAVVIFVLMSLHTVNMLMTVEPDTPIKPKTRMFVNIRDVISNKSVIKVTVMFVLYYISTYIAVPFYGTYQINELDFSLTLVSALTVASSLVRILFSRFWGTYADKHSFASMMEKCMIVLALGYLAVALATPANGIVMFVIYYVCYGIALGGINSALINLVFDYVAPDKRADSLAICQATSGLVGFLATLLVSPLFYTVQKAGNRLFGVTVYAQQIVSAGSVVVVLGAILFVRVALRSEENRKQQLCDTCTIQKRKPS